MPETLDHTLYLQPEGWPDVSDLFPIVAMTTQIQLLQDLVSDLARGRPVIEVSNIRNFRWLDLSEPQDVPITLVPKGEDVVSVSLGGYCRATLRVGELPPAPRYERAPLANPRPAEHTAQDLWDLRLMFHGPRFRGIDTLGPIGDDGLLGAFTHLDTPGSLLDNLGKLIAYWVIDHGGVGEGALPIGVERIQFFGPQPRPGEPVHCDVRIRELQRDLVRGDGVLVGPDGTIMCQVQGWSSVVFHLDGRMEPLYHRPSTNHAVDPQPGGWTVQVERWLTGAGRDLTARRFMGRAERARYQAMNVVEQRRHLLETITVKDTVRHWLAERFGIDAYPVQVVPVPDGERRFRVECPLVPAGHDPRVTVSTPYMLSDALAVMVAIVGDGEYRDIEARHVPDGADPEEVAREAAAAVQARNPDARVASVPAPEHVMPIDLTDVPEPPPFAVAWTE
ncbi:MAG TPA: polyketide synthase dehydratase domain-containing protein [Acidimicrobiales bacterium]